MNTIYNFNFLEHTDTAEIEQNIIFINRSRHHHIDYKRVILTAPRRGWSALIIDSTEPDHYLLRNLSGRLHTRAFAFGIQGIYLYYRLHKMGRTTSAYESHLALWVHQALKNLISTGDVMRLDLAEPAGRFVLRRYHEHQRSRSWTQQPSPQRVPETVEVNYQGQVDELRDLFVAGTATSYIEDILSPGFSAQAALDRLVNALNLPYLAGDKLEMPALPNSTIRRVVDGYEILKPSTWHEGSPLPDKWHLIQHGQWARET